MKVKKNFTIEEKTFERLDAYAKKVKRSNSSIVDIAIEYYLDNYEKNDNSHESLDDRLKKITEKLQ